MFRGLKGSSKNPSTVDRASHRDACVHADRCFAWLDSELIGAGRAITDSIRYAVLFDVVVLPEYQKK
jgi:hypothetical protein